MENKRAVICGYYGEGNGGDEALLVSLLQMLPPSVTPVVLSGNPQETQQRYGVETVHRRSGFSILQALRSAAVFIWGGGSLLQDATSLASPIYYAGLMVLAQQLGLETLAWGQGIGPLNRSVTRWLAQKTLQGCSAVTVRDRASAAMLVKWRIPCLLAPDPVWAMEAKAVPGLWELPAPRVAVALRPHLLLTPSRLACLTQALVTLQQATGVCLLLITFQPQKDQPIARQIASRLSGPYKIISRDDPRELKGLFQGVEMAIGMRLHSLIMAAAEQCRCFALSYDPKVSHLMEEVGIPGWELGELPTDPNVISKAWLEHYANGDPLHGDRINSLVDRALLHRDILAQICS